MTPDVLKKLQSMAGQVELRDMAKLRHALGQAAKLRAAQAALDATQAELYGADTLIVGAAYGDWLHLEQARIQRALRRAEGLAETARTGAQRSLSRRQVIEGLLAGAEDEALKLERRRAEQNGMPEDR